MKLKNAFLLAVMLYLGAAPALALAATDSLAHTQAVDDMLAAASKPDVVLANLQRLAATSTLHGDLLRHMSTHLTRADVLRRQSPLYAPMLSTATARQIAAAYRTPEGRQAAAFELAMVKAGGKASLPPAGMQAVGRFIAQPTAQAMRTLEQRVKAASPNFIGNWMAQYEGALRMAAIAALDRHEDEVDLHSSKPPAPFTLEKTGIAHIDDALAVIARTNARRTRSEWQFEFDLKKVGAGDLLAPAQLVSPPAVANQLAQLAAIEAITERHLLELGLAMKEHSASFEQLAVKRAGKVDAPLQQELQSQAEFAARYAENRRATLRATGQVLAFAAARQGQLALEQGELAFKGRTDAGQFNALVEALNSAAQHGAALETEAEQARAQRRAAAGR